MNGTISAPKTELLAELREMTEHTVCNATTIYRIGYDSVIDAIRAHLDQYDAGSMTFEELHDSLVALRDITTRDDKSRHELIWGFQQGGERLALHLRIFAQQNAKAPA